VITDAEAAAKKDDILSKLRTRRLQEIQQGDTVRAGNKDVIDKFMKSILLGGARHGDGPSGGHTHTHRRHHRHHNHNHRSHHDHHHRANAADAIAPEDFTATLLNQNPDASSSAATPSSSETEERSPLEIATEESIRFNKSVLLLLRKWAQNYKFPQDRDVLRLATNNPILAASLLIGHSLPSAYSHTRIPITADITLNQLHSWSSRPAIPTERQFPAGLSAAACAHVLLEHPKGVLNPRAVCMYKEGKEAADTRLHHASSTVALLENNVEPQPVDDKMVAAVPASKCEIHLAQEESHYSQAYNLGVATIDCICKGDSELALDYANDIAWVNLERANALRCKRLAWLFNMPLAESFRSQTNPFMPMAFLNPMANALKLQNAIGLPFPQGGGGSSSLSLPGSTAAGKSTSSLSNPPSLPSPFTTPQSAPTTEAKLEEKLNDVLDWIGKAKPKWVNKLKGPNTQSRGDNNQTNSGTTRGRGGRRRWRGGRNFNNNDNQQSSKNSSTTLLANPLLGGGK
jgi:hypothetical protein